MVGQTFRRKRIRMRLSQSELARELGVDSQTVSNWERNVYPIPRTVELAMRYLEHRRRGR